jgi:ubiquitin carboxyl-terminal hydrolase L5
MSFILFLTFHSAARYQPPSPKTLQVYELDGLQEGPILLGEITDTRTWLDIVKEEINKRITNYAANEIRFALQAVIKSKKVIAEEQKENTLCALYNHLRKLKDLQGEAFDASGLENLDLAKLAESMDVEIDLGEQELLAEVGRLRFELQNNAMVRFLGNNDERS